MEHDWIWITSVLQPVSSFRNRIYGDVLQHQDLGEVLDEGRGWHDAS